MINIILNKLSPEDILRIAQDVYETVDWLKSHSYRNNPVECKILHKLEEVYTLKTKKKIKYKYS